MYEVSGGAVYRMLPHQAMVSNDLQKSVAKLTTDELPRMLQEANTLVDTFCGQKVRWYHGKQSTNKTWQDVFARDGDDLVHFVRHYAGHLRGMKPWTEAEVLDPDSELSKLLKASRSPLPFQVAKLVAERGDLDPLHDKTLERLSECWKSSLSKHRQLAILLVWLKSATDLARTVATQCPDENGDVTTDLCARFCQLVRRCNVTDSFQGSRNAAVPRPPPMTGDRFPESTVEWLMADPSLPSHLAPSRW